MKRDSKTYKIVGRASINTTITSQNEVMADIRSIRGVTIVTFTPYSKDDPTMSYDNQNYEGELDIKIDTFPFENFDKNVVLKDIAANIKKIPAINYYRPTMVNLMENGII